MRKTRLYGALFGFGRNLENECFVNILARKMAEKRTFAEKIFFWLAVKS